MGDNKKIDKGKAAPKNPKVRIFESDKHFKSSKDPVNPTPPDERSEKKEDK